MKRVPITTFFLALFGIIFFSCEKGKIRSRSLLGKSSFSKSNKAYILIETDSFIVSTTFEKLHTVFKPWISAKNGFDEDKDLFKEITRHASDYPVYVNRLANTWKYQERLISKIAGLFENGECLVYNKITQHLETQVTIKEYHSGIGFDGRKFYVGDIVIFKTVDIIY